MSLTEEQQQKFDKIKMTLPTKTQHLLSRFPNALPEIFMEAYADGLRAGENEGRAIGRREGMAAAKLPAAEIAKLEAQARIAQKENYEKAKTDWLLNCFEGRVILLANSKKIPIGQAITQIANDFPDIHKDFLQRSKMGQTIKMAEVRSC